MREGDTESQERRSASDLLPKQNARFQVPTKEAEMSAQATNTVKEGKQGRIQRTKEPTKQARKERSANSNEGTNGAAAGENEGANEGDKG